MAVTARITAGSTISPPPVLELNSSGPELDHVQHSRLSPAAAVTQSAYIHVPWPCGARGVAGCMGQGGWLGVWGKGGGWVNGAGGVAGCVGQGGWLGAWGKGGGWVHGARGVAGCMGQGGWLGAWGKGGGWVHGARGVAGCNNLM